MMLPSTVPMVRHFIAASRSVENPRATQAAFLGGYALVWTVFGAVAFTFDLAVHRAVDSVPWLSAHQWYVSAEVLAIAGAFQFSALKDRCLDECRHPAAFLMPRYRRGTSAAFRLGRQHGLFCLGCCWALMLVMFAAGVANLAWMALLGTAMAYEKVAARGERLVPIIGVGLIAWAALVAAHPVWLPYAVAGVH
jgi:predicted metal-binding membrane protein